MKQGNESTLEQPGSALVRAVHLRKRQDHLADQPALRHRQFEEGFKDVTVLAELLDFARLRPLNEGSLQQQLI